MRYRPILHFQEQVLQETHPKRDRHGDVESSKLMCLRTDAPSWRRGCGRCNKKEDIKGYCALERKYERDA